MKKGTTRIKIKRVQVLAAEVFKRINITDPSCIKSIYCSQVSQVLLQWRLVLNDKKRGYIGNYFSVLDVYLNKKGPSGKNPLAKCPL